MSFGVTNATLDVDTSSGSKPANGTGLTASVGLDYGFTDQFQLGLFGTFPLSPQANFGAVTAYGEMQLKPDAVAFRLDVGAQQQSLKSGPPGATESSSLMGMVAGAGVPFRVRLGPKLSFVSGNPGGGGFPAQPFLAAGSTALFGDSLFTDDILTVGNWSSTTQTSIGLALHVPVGVRYQLLPNVALGVRTGYRLAISTLSDTTTGAGQTNVVHFIPLALDASAAFAGRYDAGLSLFMTGAVAGDTSQGYADVRGADLWVRALF